MTGDRPGASVRQPREALEDARTRLGQAIDALQDTESNDDLLSLLEVLHTALHPGRDFSIHKQDDFQQHRRYTGERIPAQRNGGKRVAAAHFWRFNIREDYNVTQKCDLAEEHDCDAEERFHPVLMKKEFGGTVVSWCGNAVEENRDMVAAVIEPEVDG